MRASRAGPLALIECGGPAAVIALAVLLPFLTKAFTIDDVTFLSEAKHLLVDPFHPTAFNMVGDGQRMRVSARLVTGPVMAYLLVPSVILGGAEWMAHAIQAILLSISAFATAMLGMRLGADKTRAAWAAIFLVVSPAVLGMAATAMPDIAAMSFGVLGMERISAWKIERKRSAAAMAAIFLGLAALSRPHAILLFGCAALWLYDQTHPTNGGDRSHAISLVRSIAPLVLGLAFIAAVVYVTRDPASGATVANATLERASTTRFAFNVTSFLIHWVTAFPLGVLWPFLRGRAFANPRRTLATYALGISLCILGGNFPVANWWAVLVLLCICHGIDVLVDIFLDAWRRNDWTQLMLGTWLLIALPTAIYSHLPSKFLVPSAPAMAILLALRMPAGYRVQRTLAPVALVSLAGLALGVLIILADARMAEIGRIGGRVVAREIAEGNRVWMDGWWGYQWYAEAAGAEPMARTPPYPRPGDVVVTSLGAVILRRSNLERTLLYRRVFDEEGGRIYSNGAGFFSNRIGPWPWVWGEGEIGRIEVWRIEPARVVAK